MTQNDLINSLIKALDNISLGDIQKTRDIIAKIESSDFDVSDECTIISEKLIDLLNNLIEAGDFVVSLSKGDLEIEPPKNNYLISAFKELQSNLKNLTWQTYQIAKGDYSQEIHFLGDFSIAFNSMIESLKQKEKLEKSYCDIAKGT